MKNNRNDILNKSTSLAHPRRNEPNYAWGNAIGGFLMTPNLRGFWPGSLTDVNGYLLDCSQNGNYLIPNNADTPSYHGEGLYPYVEFVRATPDYLYHYDSYIPFSDLMVWTWVYFDEESDDVIAPLISIWGGENDQTFTLIKLADNTIQFAVTSDGTTDIVVNDGGDYYAHSKWLFCLGRYLPSTELALFVGEAYTGNSDWYKLDIGIPASLFAPTKNLEIGGISAINQYLDGKLSLIGLATSYRSAPA